MSYKLDYKEPIPKVIERLRNEHKSIAPRLSQIKEEADSGNTAVAQSLLSSIKPELLRHIVEEEGRIVRIVMDEARQDSGPTVEITRYHRRVSEFLDLKLPRLLEMPKSRARQEIGDFVVELRKHQEAEERECFPLALRAYELQHAKTA